MLDELPCFDPSIFEGKKTQGRVIFSRKLGKLERRCVIIFSNFKRLLYLSVGHCYLMAVTGPIYCLILDNEWFNLNPIF